MADPEEGEGLRLMAHHRVWLFKPAPGRDEEFRQAYSGDGAWAHLFASGAGYLGTRLLRPNGEPGMWMTIDSWADRDAFERFQAQSGDAYRELDRELKGLCADERFVGAFDDV